MTKRTHPAVDATAVAVRPPSTAFPEPFHSRLGEREKRPLGDHFGLKAFGVNRTRLRPGGCSALRHFHSRQDELVYVLEGAPTLITEHGEQVLSPGMCVGFRGGEDDAHHLINRTDRDAVILEIGDRPAGDEVVYPDDDLVVQRVEGKRRFFRKDGSAY